MQFTMKKKIVLASESPRRRELLAMLNVPFEAVKSNVTENMDGMMSKDLIGYAEGLASAKAEAVAHHHRDAVVIGADTIVGRGSRAFPKPRDAEEAKAFLTDLSGKAHSVITGVAIVAEGVRDVFSVETEVVFHELDDLLIDQYIATGDPLDKAGAYGIQSGGALFVKELKGDYYAVMGLPIAELTRRLRSHGVLSLEGGV